MSMNKREYIDWLDTVSDIAAQIQRALDAPTGAPEDWDGLKKRLRSEFSEPIRFFSNRSQCDRHGSELVQDATERVVNGGEALRPKIVRAIERRLIEAVESAPNQALWSGALRGIRERNALAFGLLAEVGELSSPDGDDAIQEALSRVGDKVRKEDIPIAGKPVTYLVKVRAGDSAAERPPEPATPPLENTTVNRPSQPAVEQPPKPPPPEPSSISGTSPPAIEQPPKPSPPRETSTIKRTLQVVGSVFAALAIAITILAFVEITLYDIVPYLSICDWWPFSAMDIEECI